MEMPDTLPSTASLTSSKVGIRELTQKEVEMISGGNPLVPAAAAAVAIGGTGLLAWGVYKGGKAIGLW